jgi:hypothetical protein
VSCEYNTSLTVILDSESFKNAIQETGLYSLGYYELDHLILKYQAALLVLLRKNDSHIENKNPSAMEKARETIMLFEHDTQGISYKEILSIPSSIKLDLFPNPKYPARTLIRMSKIESINYKWPIMRVSDELVKEELKTTLGRASKELWGRSLTSVLEVSFGELYSKLCFISAWILLLQKPLELVGMLTIEALELVSPRDSLNIPEKLRDVLSLFQRLKLCKLQANCYARDY